MFLKDCSLSGNMWSKMKKYLILFAIMNLVSGYSHEIHIQKPTVGPIIGEATVQALRICIRGSNEKQKNWTYSDDKAETGIAQIAEDAAFKIGTQTRVFKLNPDFDFTGVAVFSNLDPEKKYYYRIGCSKGTVQDFLASSFDWSDIDTDSVKIHPIDPNQSISLLLGSCRYANESFGVWFGDDKGDKTLRSMYDLHVAKREIDLAIFCGDQIYADDLNSTSQDWYLDEFMNKYRHMFSKPYFTKVVRSVPTYMILDDHEIEDNWPEHREDGWWSQDTQKFVNAMVAYQAYQASHSPLFPVFSESIQLDTEKLTMLPGYKVEKLSGTPLKWWYTFEAGCCDFFVLDIRTERNLSNNPYIISPVQMNALKEFLLKNKNSKVKCVVSTVPLFPDYKEGGDQWGDKRWRSQRDEIIKFIDEHKIRRNLWMSGDIHNSYVTSLSRQNSSTKIYQVISSPIYWPFPFGYGNHKDYNLNGPLSGNDLWHTETVTNCIKENNFSRLDIDLNGFRVRVYEREGQLLDDNHFHFY